MKRTPWIQPFLLGTAALLIWCAAPGCGPTAAGYCAKRCDCEGCDEATRSLCASSIEDSQKVAKDKSCESQLNDYFSCIDSETQCIAGKIDDDGCEVELEAMKSCGVVLGTACDKYLSDLAQKLASCGITGEEPGDLDCTPAVAKQSACLDACLPLLECECLLDASNPGCSDSLQKYQDCILPCIE